MKFLNVDVGLVFYAGVLIRQSQRVLNSSHHHEAEMRQMAITKPDFE